MASGGPPKRLVVSVHDVAPSTLAEVRWLLARLDDLGIERRVLKVIPDQAGHGDLRGQPEVADLVTREAVVGSEIVLHGLTHQAPGRGRAGIPLGSGGFDRSVGAAGRKATRVDQLRARLFAGDAAEFLALTDDEAERRLNRGVEILAEIGVRASGFCAPAWLARPGLSSILRDRGFRFATWFGSVEDLATGRRLRIPTWGYMGASEAGEALVGIEARLARFGWARHPVMRVFLHPQGAVRSNACAATLRAIETVRRERATAVYADVLQAASPRARSLHSNAVDA